MGYSPQGRKESDTTERLNFAGLVDELRSIPFSSVFFISLRRIGVISLNVW